MTGRGRGEQETQARADAEQERTHEYREARSYFNRRSSSLSPEGERAAEADIRPPFVDLHGLWTEQAGPEHFPFRH